MKFKNYLHDTMICEEIVEGISEEQIESFAESVYMLEDELNELLGLGKVASKLKEKGKEFIDDAKYVAKNIAKDVGGKVATDAKEVAQSHKEIAQAAGKAVGKAAEKGKAFATDAKEVAKNIAKDVGGKIATDAKEVAQSHKEIAQAAGKSILGMLTKAQDAFKLVWGTVPKNLSSEQLETLRELDSIIKKMGNGKYLSAQESLKVLASVLAGGTSKQIPTFKAYNKQLERLKEIPGLASINLSVKNAKA